MFDGLINSFCKVQFLCYQGEPNWLGMIVLLIPGGMLFLMICAMLILLPVAIKGVVKEKILNRQEEKKRRQNESSEKRTDRRKGMIQLALIYGTIILLLIIYT